MADVQKAALHSHSQQAGTQGVAVRTVQTQMTLYSLRVVTISTRAPVEMKAARCHQRLQQTGQVRGQQRHGKRFARAVRLNAVMDDGKATGASTLKKVQLGSSDLEVSVACIGTAVCSHCAHNYTGSSAIKNQRQMSCLFFLSVSTCAFDCTSFCAT